MDLLRAAVFAVALLPMADPPLPADVPRPAALYRAVLLREVRAFLGLTGPAALIFAQVHQESSWRADVVSRAGAQGAAQFMPGTAAWIQALYPAELRQLCSDRTGCPTDLRWALRAMVLFDRRLHDEFTAVDERHRWAFALSGYNGGAGWVHREKARCDREPACDAEQWWGHVEVICLRAGWACRENRAYPRRIMHDLVPRYRVWLGPVAGALL